MQDTYLIRDERGEVVVGFASKTHAEAWLDRHACDDRGFAVEVVHPRREAALAAS